LVKIPVNLLNFIQLSAFSKQENTAKTTVHFLHGRESVNDY